MSLGITRRKLLAASTAGILSPSVCVSAQTGMPARIGTKSIGATMAELKSYLGPEHSEGRFGDATWRPISDVKVSVGYRSDKYMTRFLIDWDDRQRIVSTFTSLDEVMEEYGPTDWELVEDISNVAEGTHPPTGPQGFRKSAWLCFSQLLQDRYTEMGMETNDNDYPWEIGTFTLTSKYRNADPRIQRFGFVDGSSPSGSV